MVILQNRLHVGEINLQIKLINNKKKEFQSLKGILQSTKRCKEIIKANIKVFYSVKKKTGQVWNRITESYKLQGWKRPTGSPSPTIHPSPIVLTKPRPSTQRFEFKGTLAPKSPQTLRNSKRS